MNTYLDEFLQAFPAFRGELSSGDQSIMDTWMMVWRAAKEHTRKKTSADCERMGPKGSWPLPDGRLAELEATCKQQQSMMEALPDVYERREKVLLEQIEALTADRMAWKATAFRAEAALQASIECPPDPAAVDRQLQADALKDAARYRWLRKQAVNKRFMDEEEFADEASVDSEIDAAIASAEGAQS